MTPIGFDLRRMLAAVRPEVLRHLPPLAGEETIFDQVCEGEGMTCSSDASAPAPRSGAGTVAAHTLRSVADDDGGPQP